MLQRPVLQRVSIALPLLAGAMILMATLLPENYAALLWGFGLLLLIAGLVAAVAAWNQKRMQHN